MVDVVEVCAELIRIDSSNYGRAGARGERAAADYVVDRLRGSGYDPILLESEPGRANVVVRVPGSDRNAPGLLVHGHLDVVPADPVQWSVPPFDGVVADGYVWGRGATDMKSMVATILVTLLEWSAESHRPTRDLVFAFVADEEEDGQLGAEWLVREHAELFADVAAAIGEAGGVAVDVAATDGAPRRFYPVAVAERGSLHMSVQARGTAGHGSRPNPDNPVVHLVHRLERVARHEWPLRLSPVTTAFLERAAAALKLPADLSTPSSVTALLPRLGALRDYVEASLRSSTALTVLEAGYKVNVVPSIARAEIDVRSLPGEEQQVLAALDELLGHRVTRTMLSHSPAISAPIESPWFAAIEQAIERADPGAIVLPYCMGGGTDAKPFAKLGIAGYGFAPLGPDPDGRITTGMHGVDERVPVASLRGGLSLLRSFLDSM